MTSILVGVGVLLSFASVLMQRKVKAGAWRAFCVWAAPCGFLVYAWIPVDLGTAIFFLPFGVIALLSLVRVFKDSVRVIFAGRGGLAPEAVRLQRVKLYGLSKEALYCLAVLALVPLVHWNSRRVALGQFEERLAECDKRANTFASARPVQGTMTSTWNEKLELGSYLGPRYKATSVSTEKGFELMLRFSYDERLSVRRGEDGVYELFSDAGRTNPVKRYSTLGAVRAALRE